MKRLVLLTLVAAFVLGTISMASAVDMKVKGEFKITAAWTDNPDFYDRDEDGKSEDDFSIRERFRGYFTFVANENLSGQLALEVGEAQWGASKAFDLSGDGNGQLVFGI